jgi:hypothetical protein
MTVFPIYRAAPPSGPSSPADRAREEQAFYEDHNGPDFVGWAHEVRAALSGLRHWRSATRATLCDLRRCGQANAA